MNGQIDELYIYDQAIDATKVDELFSRCPDATPPTLASSDIVDDKGGGPVIVNTLVTYTVTFSEDMDDTTRRRRRLRQRGHRRASASGRSPRSRPACSACR